MKDLEIKLDDVFSQYIRLKSADNSGYIHCYCCGYPVHWKLAHNMHFIPRRHMGVRYSPFNCKPGCESCNSYNGGNLDAYKAHLIKEYGENIIDRLEMMKNTVTKFMACDLRDMINQYSDEVKRLRKEKGL